MIETKIDWLAFCQQGGLIAKIIEFFQGVNVMKSTKLILNALCVALSGVALISCGGGGDSGDSGGGGPISGTTLRILPGQGLSACKDTYTGKSHVNPQTLMAAGGSPFAGYTWSTSGFPMGTTVWPQTGVFVSNGGILIAENRTFTVEVSDGTSTKTGSVKLNVMTASSAPSGGVPGVPCPEAILQQYPGSSFALDDAYPNKPYGATLFAMGGTPPYSWSLDISGGLVVLPTGLFLDPAKGMIKGTVFEGTSAKTFKFSVIVRDNAGVTSSGPVYTITVR